MRVVKGNLIALEIPYSKLEALAGVKGVGSVDMPPRVSKKTDVTRQVTQAAEVNNSSAPQLPQAYTGKGVLVRETAVEGGTISTAGLPAGVYALQLGRLGSTLIRK